MRKRRNSINFMDILSVLGIVFGIPLVTAYYSMKNGNVYTLIGGTAVVFCLMFVLISKRIERIEKAVDDLKNRKGDLTT